MQTLTQPISLKKLTTIAQERFGDMTKAVVDLEKQIMVVDADLHADQERLLLKQGSKQQNLWGINLYPELYPDEDWIEYDSMINLRPSEGNNTRGVDNIDTQQQIRLVVNKLILSK